MIGANNMNGIELPDFDEMLKISDRIGQLELDIASAEDQLDLEKAAITRIVTTNKEYWIDGKKPAMNYVQATFHIEGYNDATKNRLHLLRERIVSMQGELHKLKRRFKVFSHMVDVWKADQYNKNQANY
jgi:hypothetical protein